MLRIAWRSGLTFLLSTCFQVDAPIDSGLQLNPTSALKFTKELGQSVILPEHLADGDSWHVHRCAPTFTYFTHTSSSGLKMCPLAEVLDSGMSLGEGFRLIEGGDVRHLACYFVYAVACCSHRTLKRQRPVLTA